MTVTETEYVSGTLPLLDDDPPLDDPLLLDDPPLDDDAPDDPPLDDDAPDEPPLLEDPPLLDDRPLLDPPLLLLEASSSSVYVPPPQPTLAMPAINQPESTSFRICATMTVNFLRLNR